MSKKKDKKVVQMLSPENYIRKRSRNLPIYKCWIMEDWDKIGKSHVIVSRKHVNENISFCFYLVDLFCLGVKDTFFHFNTAESDLMDRIQEENDEVQFKEIPYTLAHNIIFSAVEFAEEYGFQPHKDFIRTTKFFLEEDDDEIEFMDIECGKNGKPFYIRSESEDDASAQRIINQLKRTAGEGNYEFILDQFEELFDSDTDYNTYEKDELIMRSFQMLPVRLRNKVQNMNLEQMHALVKTMEDEEDEEKIEIYIKLIDHIWRHLINITDYNDYSIQFENFFDYIDITDEIPDAMLLNRHKQMSLEVDQIKKFVEEIDQQFFMEDQEIPLEEINQFIEQFPDYPVLYYYKVLFENHQKQETNPYSVYNEMFPNSPLLKLANEKLNPDIKFRNQSILAIYKLYFGQRTLIHSTELYEFLQFIIIKLTISSKMEGILILEIFLEELEMNDEKVVLLLNLSLEIKANILDTIMNNS